MNVTFSGTLTIQSSKAKNWYNDNVPTDATTFSPDKAYDGDYRTTYNVKDNDAVGNYLKLYLTRTHRIDSIKLTHRYGKDRTIGTEVIVYSTQGGQETKVVTCGGIISGKLEVRLLSEISPLVLYLL